MSEVVQPRTPQMIAAELVPANPQLVADLGYTQAVILLGIPKEERDQGKTVRNMRGFFIGQGAVKFEFACESRTGLPG